MELSDEIIINAPKEQVYAALNNPEILKQCIPGCEELIKHSDTELEAKGGADVTLTTDGGTTILRYKAKADIGGKLAQLGSRLIQGTAKKLAAKFFKSFADAVNDGTVA